MTEVSFAADKVYITGPFEPRQHLVTRGAAGDELWGIRSHQPLGEVNWRTVYERIKAPKAAVIAEVAGGRQLDVDFDYLTEDGTLLIFGPEFGGPALPEREVAG